MPCTRFVARVGGVVVGVVSVLFVIVVVVVVVVRRLLATCVPVFVGGSRLFCVVVSGVRRRFLCCSVYCGGRRLPSWPAWCGNASVRGLGVVLQRKPGGR